MTDYYYVHTGSSGGDGTSRALTDPGDGSQAFASLNSALSSMHSGTYSAPKIIRCAGSTADTASVNVSGASLSATNNLTIIGDNGEDDSGDGGDGAATVTDGAYFGTDQYSTSHYRVEDSTSSCINVNDRNINFDQIQVVSTDPTNFASGFEVAEREINIFRCRIIHTASNSSSVGISWNGSTFRTNTIYAQGNIISGFGTGAQMQQHSTNANTDFCRQNHFINCTTGLEVVSAYSDDAFTVNNNVFIGCTTDIVVTGSASTVTMSHCAGENTEITEHGTGWVALVPATDITDSPTNDLSPVASQGLDQAGTTGVLTTDILGNAFASPPSIGAIEVVAGGGGGGAYIASVTSTLSAMSASTLTVLEGYGASLTTESLTTSAGVDLTVLAGTVITMTPDEAGPAAGQDLTVLNGYQADLSTEALDPNVGVDLTIAVGSSETLTTEALAALEGNPLSVFSQFIAQLTTVVLPAIRGTISYTGDTVGTWVRSLTLSLYTALTRPLFTSNPDE